MLLIILINILGNIIIIKVIMSILNEKKKTLQSNGLTYQTKKENNSKMCRDRASRDVSLVLNWWNVSQ